VTKSERTRQHIVKTTAPLFNRKGFDGTSLVDLTEVTGLTKGALYGNFHDKHDIAMEAFKYSILKVKEKMMQHLADTCTYKGKLVALIDFYSRYVFNPPIPGGCPLLNTAIEADDHRKSMRAVVVKELMNTVNFIRDLLEQGIKAGEFRADIEPREIAYTLFCLIEGALMFSRVERSREPMDLIVCHCQKILDQITT
jgi:TetR/AcrR family transcriptional regulator, transcriptional repressor for nem operon